MSGELVVSSPDEITRDRLEAEATLLHSVERETECEAVTEREDTYEVIIDNNGELTYHEYVSGQTQLWLLNFKMCKCAFLNSSCPSGRQLSDRGDPHQRDGGHSIISYFEKISKLFGPRGPLTDTDHEGALHKEGHI